MPGRPSAAAERATRWLGTEIAAGRAPTPGDVARRTGLSLRQARRLCAAAGVKRPRGRPAKALTAGS